MTEAVSRRDLYSLNEKHHVRLRVHYPTDLDHMVLRTDSDWDSDIAPLLIDSERSFAEFKLELSHPFRYFKPCLLKPSGVQWATGPNRLIIATREEVQDVYPAFHSASRGRITDIVTLPSDDWGQRLHLPFQFFAGRPAVVSRILQASQGSVSPD